MFWVKSNCSSESEGIKRVVLVISSIFDQRNEVSGTYIIYKYFEISFFGGAKNLLFLIFF